LNAKGSTKSGEALEKCLVKQQKEIQNTSVENTFDELPESSTQCQVFERKLFSTERKILREDKEKGLKFFYFGDADTLPGFAHYRCEDDEPIVRFNLIISDIDKAAIILSGGAIYASAVLSDVMQIDNTTLVTKVSNCLNQSLKNVEKNGLGIGSASMVRFNPEDPSDLLVCQFPELIEGTASFTLDFFEN
jgi:hypothetical protein